MTLQFNFIKQSITELAPTHEQYDVRDTKASGLICRVNPGGSKTYMYYRRLTGKNIRVKIGRVEDISIEQARNKALALNTFYLEKLQSNAAMRTVNLGMTVAELYEQYYKEHAVPHTKRPEDNRKQIEYHILPRLGSMKVLNVSRQIMKDIHREMAVSSGQGQSNRMLNMISAVFNYGIREDLVGIKNPCIGIKRYKQRSRDRFLNKEELQLFFQGLKDEDQIYQDYFLICLLTGARKFAVLSMCWEDIDFSLKRWRLPEEKSKNDDVNIHALCDHAIEVLQRRKMANAAKEVPSNFVFPSNGKLQHLENPRKAFNRVKRRTGLQNLRIHDLRRTLASYMAIANTSMPIIAQALNHKSLASTEIYARLSIDPVRSAISNAASEIIEVKNSVKGKTKPSENKSLSANKLDNVLPFQQMQSTLPNGKY